MPKVMSSNEETVPATNELDAVLRKYGKVWLWSILITISSTFLYRSFANSSIWIANTGMPGSAGMATYMVVSGITTVTGAVAIFLSLYWLLQFLSRELVPIFFGGDHAITALSGGELLARSLGALLFATGVEAAGYLVVLVARVHG